MRKGHLGLLLLVAFIVSVITLLQDFRFDRSNASARDNTLALEHELGRIEIALADFRAAEIAYLASGQNPDFWMRRANELAGDIQSRLARLRATVETDDAQSRIAAAETALVDLYAADKRAREHVMAGERLLASDVIFGDGLDTSQRLASAVASARTPEVEAAAAAASRVSLWRLALTGAALLVALGVAVYAGRTGTQAPAPAGNTIAEMLRDLPPPVKPAPVAPQRPAFQAPAALTNLPDAAELCVDLARVLDSRDIPALLERATKVLDARGVIVWIADSTGATLRPTLTHGYPDKVLARLGSLETAADNVTSLTYRSMRAQSMTGTPGSAGAITVPIVSAAGCTGVLAAETKDCKPAAEMIAMARIIAAQFATLIVPSEMSEAQAAEA